MEHYTEDENAWRPADKALIKREVLPALTDEDVEIEPRHADAITLLAEGWVLGVVTAIVAALLTGVP